MPTNFENVSREALSIAEGCAMANMGRTKIYNAIKGGKLTARKFGKRTLILKDDLRRFLESLPRAP